MNIDDHNAVPFGVRVDYLISFSFAVRREVLSSTTTTVECLLFYHFMLPKIGIRVSQSVSE